jgi:Ni,Fe-hydrogenase I cytochrome b subunit
VGRDPGRPRRDAGGVRTIQHLRHLGAFAFAAFTTHHVYSASLGDVEERNGVMTSIFTEYTDIRPDRPDDASDA